MTNEQQRQFREQGYLVVEDMIDSEQLEALKAEYAGLMDSLYQE